MNKTAMCRTSQEIKTIIKIILYTSPRKKNAQLTTKIVVQTLGARTKNSKRQK